MHAQSRRAVRTVRRLVDLDGADDETLLAARVCDLPLSMSGTLIERRVRRLHRELAARNIVALPHAWLSEEFFNPDGVLGFAIPFYLAHPRLMRLERSQMLEVEGAGEAESRRIFRHEAGHAIDEAYRLSERPRYRTLFGDARAPYPASSNHVRRAATTSSTSPTGTHKRTRSKTSPKPSPSGSILMLIGAAITSGGRPG